MTETRIAWAYELGRQAKDDGLPFGAIHNERAQSLLRNIKSKKARVVALEKYNQGYREG